MNIHIDASALKQASCIRRLKWLIVDGLRPSTEFNYKAAYGTAYHKYFQQIDNGETPTKAIMRAIEYYAEYAQHIPTDDFRTIEHLSGGIMAYRGYYGNDDGLTPIVNPETGEPLSEIKFSIPMPELSTDEYQVLIEGTIDKICNYAGLNVISDHKVTSAQNSREFLEDFQMSVQLRMYIWAFRKLTGQLLPALINGIFISKGTKKAREAGEFDGVRFERSQIIHITEEALDEFEAWMKMKITHLVYSLPKRAEDLFDLGACYEKFGQCRFAKLCSVDKALRNDVLHANYSQTEYLPLNFQE